MPGLPTRRVLVAGALFLVQAAYAIGWAVVQGFTAWREMSVAGLAYALPIMAVAFGFALIPAAAGLLTLRRVRYARVAGILVATIFLAVYLFLVVSLSLTYPDYGFGPLFAVVFAPIGIGSLVIDLLLVL